jgi:TetR/AcrR family transcriptional repressor of nem operon
MSTKAERKQRSRESILRSASRLLRQRGIAGAGVADIMAGAGLTVGGFYAHFASKEALMDATIRQTGTQMRERLLEGLQGLPLGQRLPVILERYLSPTHRDAPDQGCPLPAVVGEVGTTAEAHRPVLQEQIELFVGQLDMPRAQALGVISLMYGGLSLSRALSGTPLSDEVLAACRTLLDPPEQERPAEELGEARSGEGLP